MLQLSDPLARALAGPDAGGATAYRLAFLALAVLTCVSGLEPVRLPADAGAGLSAAR